ncbi:MAG: KH domain-containing protein [Deltaproteobacteria bacterium]|nr:MAG: KH domain-containing protein [Deltaproteobacteria bacterium]
MQPGNRAIDLLGFIARGLVSRPEEISIEQVEDERGRLLRLKVAPSDLGMVIGREGATATAIRAVLTAATANEINARLDIVD